MRVRMMAIAMIFLGGLLLSPTGANAAPGEAAALGDANTALKWVDGVLVRLGDN